MRSMRALLATTMLASLAACGQNPAPVPPAVEQPTAETAPTPAAVAVTLAPYTAAASTTMLTHCSLDAINGTSAAAASVEAGRDIAFEGWAANAALSPAGAIRLVLIGSNAYMVTGSTAIARPDVAQAVGPGAEMSGFRFEVPALDVARGDYAIAIEAADGSFRCDTPARLTVR